MVQMSTYTYQNEPRKEFLTMNEAAALLSCTRRFLEDRIRAKELAIFHPSKRLIRIRRSDLDRWIALYTHGAEVQS